MSFFEMTYSFFLKVTNKNKNYQIKSDKICLFMSRLTFNDP